ncbi:hypothetical protein C7212DRAFT_188431 [Tuber magnatum]|uniref:Meiotic expression up-regulated protein 6 PH domain-containing protein n=1 Tax=Tuber magnatum TaxID=42249 RepID=A0A317SRJ0_9PEZI|nr:hypothetical protein C7212DRAFT_188431 [Tuber magnatum]
MSDAVKPEDTKPVATELPKPTDTEEVAAVSETVAAPATTSDEVTPVATDKPVEEAAAVEDKKEDDKSEPKEITQGTLSKFPPGPSGLMSFFKTKRFFYFQDEPIAEDKLKVCLQKNNATRATAAYASQTGKGLLLYSKAERQSPHGIIKLADVTEVTSVGATKFVLKIPSGGDLHFESPGDRDNWVFTLKHKITEAKEIVDEIVNSEGYKAALEKLTKSVPTVAAKAPEKSTEAREERKEAGEAKPEEGVEKRSASKNKKRASVFGFLRKDRTEEKKEESAEGEESKEEPKAVEPTTAATTDAPAETSAVAAAEVKETEDVKPVEVTKEAEKVTEAPAAPKPPKRHSYFNVNVFNREKKDKEVAEDKKEEEAKPEATAPKTETEAASPEVKPVDVVAPEASTAAEKSPTSSPPKSRFYTGLFERKSEKTEKEPETKLAEATSEPVAAPAVATDSSVAPAEESTAAEATGPKEQKRKSSFFSFKKDKKADDVKSDNEEGEPSSPKPSTSPVPKPGLLTGLMRKTSKASKGKETEPKEVVAPAAVAEETTPAAPTTTTETETPNGAPATTEQNTIGDVVPEAVNVGQAHSVQAAA